MTVRPRTPGSPSLRKPHYDTHAIPLGNYVSAVGNYVSVSPSELGNYVSADTQDMVDHSFSEDA